MATDRVMGVFIILAAYLGLNALLTLVLWLYLRMPLIDPEDRHVEDLALWLLFAAPVLLFVLLAELREILDAWLHRRYS